MNSSPRVVALINLKGGTSKTTSSVYLADALREAGFRVTMVDADPQGSALRWQGLADLPVPVMGMPTPTLHRQIWRVIDPAGVDIVVIDSPPLEEQMGIVASILRVATDVIVPMAPTMMELDRINPVWNALADAQGSRDTDPNVWVLLNRTVANAASTNTIRGLLEEQHKPVFETTIPRLEAYAQAFGSSVPASDADGHYLDVAAELLDAWKQN
ncbi:ParA family protein [Natronoglycomyces albus]|uniref:ParA family protein n=1 Tax=Natronoglycomyces albus TaxID=2811108 RepID=A0A895XUS9_9ACTN|nr:ParA family protein [Natronoglycomyces albus]QSB07135.1 ParA family protein [Natronoglycomyces albus]